ncbi:MAG: MBL fold metallo-hydrolase [Chloroflexota bacterium]
MMQSVQREKVADNVYYFQSETYAVVTAGVIVGPQWAVLIDTLATPEEIFAVRQFVEHDLGVRVRYIVNTHYHADHAWGNCFFPEATVIGHKLARDFLEQRGKPSLESSRKINASYKKIQIILPQVTFESGSLILQVGKKSLNLMPLPGHTADGIGVFIEEDRVLFAGDAFMELPFIVDGNLEAQVHTLKEIAKFGLENIIQGHGDIILRGEIDGAIRENLSYLAAIRHVVEKAHKKNYPGDYLTGITVEDSGKSRVLIGGMAEELHQRNLKALYRQVFGELPALEEFDDEG